jgi:hypothetical protein
MECTHIEDGLTGLLRWVEVYTFGRAGRTSRAPWTLSAQRSALEQRKTRNRMMEAHQMGREEVCDSSGRMQQTAVRGWGSEQHRPTTNAEWGYVIARTVTSTAIRSDGERCNFTSSCAASHDEANVFHVPEHLRILPGAIPSRGRSAIAHSSPINANSRDVALPAQSIYNVLSRYRIVVSMVSMLTATYSCSNAQFRLDPCWSVCFTLRSNAYHPSPAFVQRNRTPHPRELH